LTAATNASVNSLGWGNTEQRVKLKGSMQ